MGEGRSVSKHPWNPNIGVAFCERLGSERSLISGFWGFLLVFLRRKAKKSLYQAVVGKVTNFSVSNAENLEVCCRASRV